MRIYVISLTLHSGAGAETVLNKSSHWAFPGCFHKLLGDAQITILSGRGGTYHNARTFPLRPWDSAGTDGSGRGMSSLCVVPGI